MENINYDNLMNGILSDEHPKVLLHCCCGPCATACIERIKDLCELTLAWYNPNIMPIDEYEKRKQNFIKVADYFGVPYIDLGNDDTFIAQAKGLENEREGGARCPVCFEIRLRRVAIEAKKLGYDYFATTLTVSPHKNAKLINGIGEKIAQEIGIKWLFSDFKKKGGFLRSTVLCEEIGVYRQNYCGCLYAVEAEKREKEENC